MNTLVRPNIRKWVYIVCIKYSGTENVSTDIPSLEGMKDGKWLQDVGRLLHGWGLSISST